MAKKTKGNISNGARALLAWSQSTGQCADPECQQPLILFDKGIPVVNFEYAHIRDENPHSNPSNLKGIGWRYPPEDDMTQEQRNLASNLILVCKTTHKVIDFINPRAYSVELLHECLTSAPMAQIWA